MSFTCFFYSKCNNYTQILFRNLLCPTLFFVHIVLQALRECPASKQHCANLIYFSLIYLFIYFYFIF